MFSSAPTSGVGVFGVGDKYALFVRFDKKVGITGKLTAEPRKSPRLCHSKVFGLAHRSYNSYPGEEKVSARRFPCLYSTIFFSLLRE